jgi:predicted dehydrogenase
MELKPPMSPLDSKVRFAIVGCGLIGGKRANALPPGSLTAVCDLIPERAAALAARSGPQCVATSSLQQMLDTGPDAVIVSTLNANLGPVALECLQAGKHVLVEKPVTVSLAEMDQIIECAAAKNLLVRAGYNHRYHPAFQQARRIFDSGVLGPMMFVRARYGHGGRVNYDKEWRSDPRLSGGGELIDQGVHLIDLAGWFLGDWTQIDGWVNTFFWNMPVDDNAFLHLCNSSGQTAWLHASCTEWKNLFSFEVYGKLGKLHIDGLGGSYGVERLYHYQMLPEMGPPETTIYEYPRGDDSWGLETREFVEDIRLQRQPTPGLKEARAVMHVVDTVYRRSESLHQRLALAE